jgi:HD-GYP domain-containing protein (c-di-GMP phosphodiesterase class II)
MYVNDLAKVTPGTVLGETIYGASGQPLLYAGVALTSDYLADLRKMGIAAVYVRDADTADIEIPHPVSPEARGRAMQHLTRAFEAVAQACESLREASVQAIQEHLQSERFASTVRSVGSFDMLVGLSGDVDQFLEQLMNREVLAGLNSIKAHDAYTFQHSIDVTIMAVVLAKRLGWERSRIKAFAMGCMLHDIGKIFIDPSILNKPGRLSGEEYERVKAHPTLGHSIIRALAPGLGALVPLVAHQHHEKQDGTGYPRGLRGDNTIGRNRPGLIHDFGAVAAVADIYDAVSSDRPYRVSLAPDRVVKLIRGLSRSHLNRIAVDVFGQCVAPYPVGTRVRIMTGKYAAHEGIVAKVHQHALERPLVRVMYVPSGQRMEPREIDLRGERDVSIESVPRGAGVASGERAEAA